MLLQIASPKTRDMDAVEDFAAGSIIVSLVSRERDSIHVEFGGFSALLGRPYHFLSNQSRLQTTVSP